MTWPPHSLVLTSDPVVLRGLTEPVAQQLAVLAPDDLELDPRLPELGIAGQRRAHVLQSYWREVGSWSPQDWQLSFSVHADGELVGLQALEGKDFAVRRTVDSHSWLVPLARGKGLGKRMRAAVLELAFGYLDATHAVTEAWEDNAASLGVSRALGYVDNGVDLHSRDGGVGRMQRLLLASQHWTPPWPVEVSGLAECLPMLGLPPGVRTRG